MPSRVVREGINSSPRINALSPLAELFYRRLMSVADDHGRFFASPATLRGACWPTCPEKVTESQITDWLNECLSGDRPLIEIYESDGAKYLKIDGFNQQARSKSKFPEPKVFIHPCLAVAKQMISTGHSGQHDDVEPSRSRSRSRISESKSESHALSARDVSPIVEQGWESPEHFEQWWSELVAKHPNRVRNAVAKTAFLELVMVGRITKSEFEAGYDALRQQNGERWSDERGRFAPNLHTIVTDSLWRVSVPRSNGLVPLARVKTAHEARQWLNNPGKLAKACATDGVEIAEMEDWLREKSNA